MRIPSLLVLPLLLALSPTVARADPHVKPAGGSGGPIIGQNVRGKYVEKETGAQLETPTDITLYSHMPERFVAAAYQDGRETLFGGGPDDLVLVTYDAARFEAGTRSRLGARSLDSSVDFKATLVAVNGGGEASWNEDPDALNNLQFRGDAEASIGAQGLAETKVGLTGGALYGGLRGDALLGARTSGQISASPTLCGAKIIATGKGQLSLGIGATINAGFRVDWATWSAKIGGKIAGTYGVGAGGGGEVEINLEKIMNDPRAAGRCVTDGAKAGIQALSDGYDHIEKKGAQLLADVIVGAKYWRYGVPVPTGSSPPGSNVGRFEETRSLGAPQPSDSARTNGGPSGKVGVTR